MYTVLVPVDANANRAIEQAKVPADLPNASESVHVTLLRVFDDPAANPDSEMVDPTRVKSVTDLEDFLEDSGVSVDLRGETGKIVPTILNVASEIDANLIVMGGRARSPVGKAILGSVSQDVILNADRPVAVA